MPDSCSAWGCKNRRTIQTKALGITFHKFPKAKELRLQWDTAVRREGFFTKKYAVVCSEHFRLEDFDSTGQTVRIRDGAVPIAVSFPTHLKRPMTTRTTQTSKRAAESLSVKTEPLPDVPVTTRTTRVSRRAEESRSVTEPLPDVDHTYALSASPEDLKVRLSEALARVESLERQVRNLKDRERRAKAALHGLLKHLRGTLPPPRSVVKGGRNVIRTKCRKKAIR
ncbi:THAP domain-containing protein 6 isoform X2 [Sebastes umbrosus]|uniref:THAP domain-containing protein 6 isoform X2 n=1 Tax=Sebastes umbrosus TaxID=72105 RepID=UPI00189E4B13|nr:THAP domain-containing protein 6 isoform X2 [Sebastes umbrosus]